MNLSCRRVVSGVVALSAIGCGLLEPRSDWVSQPASFVGIQVGRIIAVDDTVAAGSDVRIIVSSFGSSSCMRRNGVSFSQRADLVRVTQRVLVQTGDVACTDDLRQFPETLQVRFAAPGRVTVRAIGQRRDAATSPDFAPDSVERSIVVR